MYLKFEKIEGAYTVYCDVCYKAIYEFYEYDKRYCRQCYAEFCVIDEIDFIKKNPCKQCGFISLDKNINPHYYGFHMAYE